MKVYLDKNLPDTGDTIEFLKDLRPEDREEFLFGKGSEEEAINEFLNALPYSETYALRLPCGKILAMGGFVDGDLPGEYRVWLLCARGSEKYPKALYKSVKKVLNETEWYELWAEVYRRSFNHTLFVVRGLGFTPVGNIDKDFTLYSRAAQCAI